jgi:23S rRNA (cytidine1920-2'-O)/16S rRNA (cytidine1409-2'-O)-methyltransferase
MKVSKNVALTVSQPERYVGRGAYKLLHALRQFPVKVEGRFCLDLGASTGGFTQVLLEEGAAFVYAVDVGQAQLHQSIREHPKVCVIENENARFLTRERLPGLIPQVVTADLSFISLTKALPAALRFLEFDADLIALVKPQFEATKQEVSRGRGVITSPEIWRRALESVVHGLLREGWSTLRVCRSPIAGGSGNVEFLLYGKKEPNPRDETMPFIALALKEDGGISH